ncbi:17302_t:CDS:10 [Gigaspora margarita]|uniref:17302_t:CDS:1 n=1 Tax=Gigaspora margarita TaxID=4874 RepID=A0ABM8W370_GIGMA|nr:17302_t:CDS:10 [Gigaspora margarita]
MVRANYKEENKKYNEKYDYNRYDDEEYNEEYNEECNDECGEKFDIDAAFNEILKILEISEIMLYKLQRLLGNLVPFKPTLIDCCINSYIAFTNEFINMKYCSECNEPRYKFGKALGESRKSAAYWPLVSSLQMQYRDKTQVEALHYRDVALMASTDGYQIFRQKRNDCWVILFMNANLPPDVCVQHENLMISALILEPKAPKNFNTFFYQFKNCLALDDFCLFQILYLSNFVIINTEGIQCIESVTEETFILCAHILSWSGDILALTKVMCTTGHNSYKACQFCSIHGACCKENRHIYFLLKPLNGVLGCQYDPKNLLLWTYEDYLLNIAAIECLNRSSHKREVQKRDIGKVMDKNKKNMPLSFGCLPIDIHQHSTAFKAEHWLNWIVLYSIPLLQGNLPKRHLNGWAKFVHAVKLCLKHKIDTAELLEINQLFCEFVTHYKKEYLQNNPSWLPAVLISYHYLLHIASSIRNTGPAWATWQYPMERLYVEEKLYSVALNYYMNKTEMQHLKAYYATALNKPINRLNAKLLVDHNANYRNAPDILEMQEFFGEWVHNPQFLKHGPLKFRKFGSLEVINISVIDRNVGFLKMLNNECI